MKTCCDCGKTKLSKCFNWNAKTKQRNAWCRDCGRVLKSKRSFKALAKSTWYRKPNLSMSILGRD